MIEIIGYFHNGNHHFDAITLHYFSLLLNVRRMEVLLSVLFCPASFNQCNFLEITHDIQALVVHSFLCWLIYCVTMPGCTYSTSYSLAFVLFVLIEEGKKCIKLTSLASTSKVRERIANYLKFFERNKIKTDSMFMEEKNTTKVKFNKKFILWTWMGCTLLST